MDSFFGMLTENLLKGLHREVMISKFLMPINTITPVIVAVPPKAEYEAGFLKWMTQFCRLGSTLGCRVHFFANEETTTHLQALVKAKGGEYFYRVFLLGRVGRPADIDWTGEL